jgi:hypothetical protein
MFPGSCCLSLLPIAPETPVKFLLLTEMVPGRWGPRSIPIDGVYDGFNSIEPASGYWTSRMIAPLAEESYPPTDKFIDSQKDELSEAAYWLRRVQREDLFIRGGNQLDLQARQRVCGALIRTDVWDGILRMSIPFWDQKPNKQDCTRAMYGIDEMRAVIQDLLSECRRIQRTPADERERCLSILMGTPVDRSGIRMGMVGVSGSGIVRRLDETYWVGPSREWIDEWCELINSPVPPDPAVVRELADAYFVWAFMDLVHQDWRPSAIRDSEINLTTQGSWYRLLTNLVERLS